MVGFVLGLKELFCRQRGKISALEKKLFLNTTFHQLLKYTTFLF